jgi:hypothetical protein
MELNDSGRAGRPASRATLILGLYAAISLLGILIAALRGDWEIYRLESVSTPARLALSPLMGVAIGLAVVFCTRLAVHRFDWARHLHRDFRGLLGGLSSQDVLILAVASAVGEELFFRGALLPWIGLWPSTIVFGLLHIGPGARFVPWTVSALVMGLCFGVMFTHLGDLGGPIAAHFTINFMNLGYIVRVELPE